MKENNRRKFLKKLALTIASTSMGLTGISLAAPKLGKKTSGMFRDNFHNTSDRVWLGEDYWSIPLEDWQVKNKRIECTGNVRNSRVNILTTILEDGSGIFKISADLGLLPASETETVGSAGFLLGVTDQIDNDIKSICYFGKGLSVGVDLKGELFIGNQKKHLPTNFNFANFTLSVEGVRSLNNTALKLRCIDIEGNMIQLDHKSINDIVGIVNIVNNFTERGGAKFWFKNLEMSGNKFRRKSENSFGPILWSMHTLSKKSLRLMAQMPPIGSKDSQTIELQFNEEGQWVKEDIQRVDPVSFTAHFHVQEWNSTRQTPYRLKYLNQGKTYYYNGTIGVEPQDRPLKFAGLTCQEWSGYPYGPLVDNLKKHNPDLLYFSGDQLYEFNGGYQIKRYPEEAAILSYLGKWFMFGWAFREIMRDKPTICTPDDHDVFQGNIWGEGGRILPLESWERSPDDHGGYVQTPGMLNVVTKTQCGHLPAAFDSQELYSGMKTWYTDMVYGKVSFAIISDRMFKSGPEMVRWDRDRLDHITEPLETNELEDRNLTLLGAGQMNFLEQWIEDWEGSNMKVLLSQTIFANVGTHHGPQKMFLYGDMDSGGWPKKQRDKVLRLVRKASAFHINGDQHLPFLVQYSVDEPRDCGWTFCTPAISTGYPRWGQPDLVDTPFTNRPEHGLPNTGLYQDGFGNTNYIYAVGNPLDNFQDSNRYQRAHNKSSGFGIIVFNPITRTIEMNAYHFLSDMKNPKSDDQFEGWPLTISQTDNDGRKPVNFLPRLEINKPNQLVKLFEESTNELVSVMRIKGSHYSPPVFSQGPFRLEIGEGIAKKVLTGIQPIKSNMQEETLRISI